jgi:hypothetical protein
VRTIERKRVVQDETLSQKITGHLMIVVPKTMIVCSPLGDQNFFIAHLRDTEFRLNNANVTTVIEIAKQVSRDGGALVNPAAPRLLLCFLYVLQLTIERWYL